MYACVPQRISTLAPLSEVILSGDTVWIRTKDSGLWHQDRRRQLFASLLAHIDQDAS